MSAGRFCLAAALMVAALSLSACGGSDGDGDDRSNPTGSLTIYSSMPLRGVDGPHGREIVNGQKLALAEAGGIVNDFRVKYVSLDASDGAKAAWTPGAVAANARHAVQDRSTIAYIGDFSSGASAVSAPITNAAGILQVSPASTYGGLTRADGGDKGEPEKYSPSGKLTFARVIPNDIVQAAALVEVLEARRARRAFIAYDRSVYGQVLARETAQQARREGIQVVPAGDAEAVDLDSEPASAVEEVRSSGADAFVLATSTSEGAVELWQALHAADPGLVLVGSAALASPAFAQAIGAAGRTTLLTSPILPVSSYPPPARAFARRYRQRFGESPSGSYALFGYESVKAVLAAISAARDEGNERSEVIERFFALPERRSVLGPYEIDPYGDTTLSDYGAYAVRRGRLVYSRSVSG